MTSVLGRYFRRRIGMQILGLLTVLTALMQLLELLDMTTDILKRGLGLRGLAYYAWLRTPGELVLALPIAVLLGSMMAFYAMARSLEITTIRSAGVSLKRVFLYLLPVLLLLAAVQFALSDRVLPQADNTFKEWWSASAPPDDTPTRLWVYTDGGPVSIDRISPDGRRLDGVRLYQRDAQGLITGRVAAAHALWKEGAWMLQEVAEIGLGDGRVSHVREASRAWKTNLTPDEVLRLDVSRPHLSSMMLADVIAGTRVGTQPMAYYRTVLYRSFTAPLAVFVMVLLALPMACWQPRGSSGGREMLVPLLLGLAFLLCDGIVSAIGTSGRLPPLVTALAAPSLFIVLGIIRLQAYERI